MDQANDGIAIMKFTGDAHTPIRIVYANEALQRISGFSRQELLDPANPFLHAQPQNRERYEGLLAQIRSGRSVRFEIELTGKTRSTWAEIRWSPLRYNADQVTHYVAVLRDISAEEQLLLLQSVLSHTSDFVVTADATRPSDGGPVIGYANSAFCSLVGLEHERVVGARLPIFFSPDNEARTLAGVLGRLERQRDVSQELRVRNASGSDSWIELSGHTVRDERGRIKSWVFIGKDISVRKQGYIQTAELMRALDLADEPIAIYDVMGPLDLRLQHMNDRAAKLPEPLLERVLREPMQRERIAAGWEALQSGHIVRRLVRVLEEGAPRWVTFVLQPIRDARSITSVVAIQHYVGSSGPPPDDDVARVVMLAREILGYEIRATRRDAVVEVLREEWRAAASISRTDRPVDVVLRAKERSGEAVMPPGVLFANEAALRLTWPEVMPPQRLTALRVFLEALSRPSERV